MPGTISLRYALALVDDLTDAQMVLRPGGNMNHPAWILGHLSEYHPATIAMLSGKPFEDPKFNDAVRLCGQGPQDDIARYGSKEKIVSRFSEGHEQVAQALLAATPGSTGTAAVDGTLGGHLSERRIHLARPAAASRKPAHRTDQHLAAGGRVAGSAVPKSDAAAGVDSSGEALILMRIIVAQATGTSVLAPGSGHIAGGVTAVY